MSKKFSKTVRILDERAREYAIDAIRKLPLDPAYQISIKLAESKRSLVQNKLMWVLLGQLAERGTWWNKRLDSEDWKHILTASLGGEIRMVQNADATGFIFLPFRTRKLSVKKMSELIDFIYYMAYSDTPALKFDGFEDAPLPGEWIQWVEERSA